MCGALSWRWRTATLSPTAAFFIPHESAAGGCFLPCLLTIFVRCHSRLQFCGPASMCAIPIPRRTYPEWSLALVQAQVQRPRTHPLAVEIVLEDHGDLLWDCWQVLLPHLHRWKYINIGATYTLYCELIQGMLQREAALPSLEYLELRLDDSINTKPAVLAQLACSCPQVRHLAVLNVPIILPPLCRNTTAPMSMSNLAELSIDNPRSVIELDALVEVLKHLAPTLSTLALACARITCESDLPTFPSLPQLHKLFLANLLSAIVSESVATFYCVRRAMTALPAELAMGCKPNNA